MGSLRSTHRQPTNHMQLYTWGSSTMGKLGHGMSSNMQQLPRMVKGELSSQHVISCSLGMSHSGCITDTGATYTWGGGWFGRLGLGRSKQSDTAKVDHKIT